MLDRRTFLTRTLQGSSLLALGGVVPQFLANTARAAEVGKDSILVVVEMSGGNDGLNTVIPYADDIYQKARPTLRFTKDKVIKVDDYIGLHPAMKSFGTMLQNQSLAIVQGIGYPNPDRSHFESMDVWQSGDPLRKVGTGWIGRSTTDLQDKKGNVPVVQLGPNRLPLALQGSSAGVVSINNEQAYILDMGKGDAERKNARRKLIQDLAEPTGKADDMLQFIQRRQLQTYSTLDRLRDVLKEDKAVKKNPQDAPQAPQTPLTQKMALIARLIAKGFGTRVFYVMIDGFDTHSGQAEDQQRLLADVSDSISFLFTKLKETGHDKRVLAMTFSEFGRRVHENGSKGTDHGAASCLFVAGPAVKSGAINKHPSMKDLDAGDLKHHTDFRQLYATLLDQWLGVDSKTVLGAKFDHLELLRGKT
ncbi:MAG TPA: DUF1501 domain-containing protein [Gemmataceae bacterium]|jgi:uncharacterized protein (DUF1501 family)|nr:DUF1501 domain-containing protein [Gemmataceae bacterium]